MDDGKLTISTLETPTAEVNESSNHLTNPDLERSVLGAFLEDQNFLRASLERGINVDCFSTTIHRKIFEALCALEEQGTPVDSFTVVEHCGCDPDVIACIADCVTGCVLEFSHVMSHVSILQKKARLRALGHIGEWLQEQSGQFGADPELLTQSAMTAITEGRLL